MKRVDVSTTIDARRRHIGRLLFELSAHFEAESLKRLQLRGHRHLTQGQKQVIVHLPLKGARLTTLAERAGVSKQAMMRLVDGLEARGYVLRRADPEDGRAKFVQFTTQGRQLINDGLAVVEELEREYKACMTGETFETLRAGLALLVDGLDIRLPDDAGEVRQGGQ